MKKSYSAFPLSPPLARSFFSPTNDPTYSARESANANATPAVSNGAKFACTHPRCSRPLHTPTPTHAAVATKTDSPLSLYVSRSPFGRTTPCFFAPGRIKCVAIVNAIQPRKTRHASTEKSGTPLGHDGSADASIGHRSSLGLTQPFSLQNATRP